MKTFKEVFLEIAQAKKGNWLEGVEFVRNFSKETIEQSYILQCEINIPSIKEDLFLYKHKFNTSYIMGGFVEVANMTKNGLEHEDRFKAIFSISLEKINLKDYINSFVVKGVAVIDDEDYQKSGISYFMYQYFVKTLKYTLVGDAEQYFGARKLWVKLSKNIDLKVDIYDIQDNILIYKDVILHHGKYDSDFDERLWSYSKDKHYVRSVLTELL